MAINLEKELALIENELKSLKVCYNTAGSLVKMYVTKMTKFTVGGSATNTNVTVRFTPKFGQGQKNLITLVAIVDSNTYYIAPFMVAPQDGSGNVEITIYALAPTQKVEVIASGTSPGTFTRIA